MIGWLAGLLGRNKRASVPDRDQQADHAIDQISTFVRTWPDQKLHDVFAFCQDGKMEYHDDCTCLLGVFGSEVLHVDCFLESTIPQAAGLMPAHYHRIRIQPGMAEVERAYFQLGHDHTSGIWDSQALRDTRLLEILFVEMTRRQQTPDVRVARETVSIGA